MSLDAFTTAYIGCALWSSTDNADESGGEPLDDNFGPEDLTPEALVTMQADCKSFYEDPNNAEGLDLWRNAFGSDEQAGHDFWLTRNGHGAGFWDRFYGETDESRAGEALSKAAEIYGSAELYVNDGVVCHG